MEERKLHQNLETVRQLMSGLSQMLGSRYELVLHDLSHVESSIVEIKGNITNRKIGGPVTNYLLKLIKKYGDEASDSINYRNITTDGKILRSSTVFIRDEEGRIIGSLCINQDLTDFIVVSKLTQEMVSFQETEEENSGELFVHDINEVMESMVQSELNTFSKPVAYMQKEDKLSIVGSLAEKGIFDVKGSVEYVAERLGVTHFTIYNYLKEVRVTKK